MLQASATPPLDFPAKRRHTREHFLACLAPLATRERRSCQPHSGYNPDFAVAIPISSLLDDQAQHEVELTFPSRKTHIADPLLASCPKDPETPRYPRHSLEEQLGSKAELQLSRQLFL
ncbi:hypothetical protein NW755_000432 [Fusarium falciforme]|uniref:Uncharacterized protein n=1 Tax=Fusarium falciforme TaxID=195108 RepID=A0A9W8V5K2_9HYPO|nr:hypothetical protein NW755_000432 [Fusarium falciforme]KAJ4262418.1 hypothetical protein NW757_000678 [Fusarium falciforme]